jgi:hypothetical protein
LRADYFVVELLIMKRKSIYLSLSLSAVIMASSLTAITSCKKEAKVSLPVLTTSAPTDIWPIAATCGGTVVSEGGEPTWLRGICWSTTPTPTINPALNFDAASAVNENYNGVTGTGSFSFPMNGLLPIRKYYVRAFAQNSAGVGYGNEVSFSTPALVIGAKVAGGIAFDIDTSGLHGLACAPVDQDEVSWSNGNYVTTSASYTDDGYNNTDFIYKAEGITGDYAALNCVNLTYGYGVPNYHNSFFTWYLPSKDELNKLYLQKNVIGGFSDGSYWSSTEFDLKNAWDKNFSSGKDSISDKAISHNVRAIRAF